MKQQPFFSVIVPTYNRAKFIGISVNSVLTQTFEDFELLIIDDGSTDHTESVLREYKDQRLRYLYQENRGPAAARNLGVKNSRGKFIAFLDSDDRFRIDKLLVAQDHITRNPEYRVFHTEEIWYRNGQYLPQKIYLKKPSGYIFENSVKLCSVGMSTSVVERSVFDEVGFFDERFPACEDYDFWLRVASRLPVLLIPQYLTIKEGGHEDQLSKRYPVMDAFRIEALKNILNTTELCARDRAIAEETLRSKCAIVINGALKRGKTAQAHYYREILQRIGKKHA